MWAMFSSVTACTLFATGTGMNNRMFNIYVDASYKIAFYGYGGGATHPSIRTLTMADVNKWLHLAVTYDGTTTEIFVDKVSVGKYLHV